MCQIDFSNIYNVYITTKNINNIKKRLKNIEKNEIIYFLEYMFNLNDIDFILFILDLFNVLHIDISFIFNYQCFNVYGSIRYPYKMVGGEDYENTDRNLLNKIYQIRFNKIILDIFIKNSILFNKNKNELYKYLENIVKSYEIDFNVEKQFIDELYKYIKSTINYHLYYEQNVFIQLYCHNNNNIISKNVRQTILNYMY